jgi:acetyl esterase
MNPNIHTVAGHAADLLIEEHPHKGAARVLVFFHAGKFVSRAGLEAGRQLAAALKSHTLIPHYALAPEHPFPAAPEDAYRALEWAAKRYRALPLVLIGEEAGANLAAVSALIARDRQRPNVAAQILFSPLLDATLCSRSHECLVARYGADKVNECDKAYRAYLPRQTDRTHPYASPAAASRLTGLPPALMLLGESDALREDADAYAARLLAAGIKVEVRRQPGEHASLDVADAATLDAIERFLVAVSPTHAKTAA